MDFRQSGMYFLAFQVTMTTDRSTLSAFRSDSMIECSTVIRYRPSSHHLLMALGARSAGIAPRIIKLLDCPASPPGRPQARQLLLSKECHELPGDPPLVAPAIRRSKAREFRERSKYVRLGSHATCGLA